MLHTDETTTRAANRKLAKMHQEMVLIVLRDMPDMPSLGRMEPALNYNTGTCSWGSCSTNVAEGYLGKTTGMKMCFDYFTLCEAFGLGDLVFSS